MASGDGVFSQVPNNYRAGNEREFRSQTPANDSDVINFVETYKPPGQGKLGSHDKSKCRADNRKAKSGR